jgi:SAM-dependent methyltransferase
MFESTEKTGVAIDRWHEAQQYEQSFWKRLGDDIEAGTREHLDWYKWRAEQLDRRLSAAFVPRPPQARILEIGSGPIGIVNFLTWGERFAIDPLEHFYQKTPTLIALRNPGVTYLDGTGEQLPFDDGTFALVIIDNVIDHTSAPAAVLQQINRVLAADGHLYLSVNVHTRWGALLHECLAGLHIDKGHPHTFTSATLRRLLQMHGFIPHAEHVEDYNQVRRADRIAPRLTDRIKGYTGLSEYSHGIVCRK